MNEFKRGIGKVNLNNLISNVEAYKKILNKNTKICIVVKANAYGHGLLSIANATKNLCDYFAVATFSEALLLRQNSIKTPILVLGYVDLENIEACILNNINFSIFNLDYGKEVAKIQEKLNKQAKVHIALDTGMGRIGFLNNEDFKRQIKEISKMNFQINGIFSHFATGDCDLNYVNFQFQQFNEMTAVIEDILDNHNLIKHISNSYTSLFKKYNKDMVRLGIGIYGYLENQDLIIKDFENLEKEKVSPINLKPVLTYESLVINVKKLKKGDSVGYSRTYFLKEDGYILTIPLGYHDSIIRSISNKNFKIKIGDNTYGEIVGNVCMDQFMVFTKEKIDLFQKVYIFGYNENSLLEMAKKANTIPYEIISNIPMRIERLYIKNE